MRQLVNYVFLKSFLLPISLIYRIALVFFPFFFPTQRFFSLSYILTGLLCAEQNRYISILAHFNLCKFMYLQSRYSQLFLYQFFILYFYAAYFTLHSYFILYFILNYYVFMKVHITACSYTLSINIPMSQREVFQPFFSLYIYLYFILVTVSRFFTKGKRLFTTKDFIMFQAYNIIVLLFIE